MAISLTNLRVLRASVAVEDGVTVAIVLVIGAVDFILFKTILIRKFSQEEKSSPEKQRV